MDTDTATRDQRQEPTYPLVRSAEEYERLRRQSNFFGGTTERLFRAAGLGPGMRVLDVGCGAGDVTLLAAGLVGPEGEIVGVDTDRAALDVARGRARSLRLSNVSFVEGDAGTVHLDGTFDAAVARFVLMYAKDPAALVRRIAERVRPGGVVAVQELDLDPAIASRSVPGGTLWDETGNLLVQTFARAGIHMRMGPQLFTVFLDGGLPEPQMREEALVGGGPDFGGYAWMADVVRSVSPLMAKLAVADIDELGLGTLADRLRDDTVARRGVVWTPALVGAYARKPPGATMSA